MDILKVTWSTNSNLRIWRSYFCSKVLFNFSDTDRIVLYITFVRLTCFFFVEQQIMNIQENEVSNWRTTTEIHQYKFDIHTETEFPCILPASGNWYLSGISSCLNGYAAYGGKNGAYIFNLRKSPPVCEGHIVGSSSMTSKVTAVELLQCENIEDPSHVPTYCAVGMEDGVIRIIGFTSKVMYKEHRKHKVR